jgi:hypothetical protein
MVRNMGIADRVIRVLLAIVGGILYVAGAASRLSLASRRSDVRLRRMFPAQEM